MTHKYDSKLKTGQEVDKISVWAIHWMRKCECGPICTRKFTLEKISWPQWPRWRVERESLEGSKV